MEEVKPHFYEEKARQPSEEEKIFIESLWKAKGNKF